MGDVRTEEIILKGENLTKSFGKGKKELRAVQPMSLVLRRGACLGLVGESGSGKTTLGRMAASLLRPTSGDLYLLGQNVRELQRTEKRRFYRHVQMVFQNPVSAFSPRMDIETFLCQGLKHFRLAEKRDLHQEAVRLLREVGLPEEFCGRFPSQLSGGELQRVVIARALSVQPELIILDEPTSALDVSVQQQILELLIRLQKSHHMTYLLISHNLAVVRKMSDRIGIMYRGWLLEVLDREELEGEELHPYTKELLWHVLYIGRSEPKLEKADPEEETAVPEGGCPFYHRCREKEESCKDWKPDPIVLSESHWTLCSKRGQKKKGRGEN